MNSRTPLSLTAFAGSLLLASLLAVSANATVVHDESIDGELGMLGDSTPLGAFSAGTNSVIGELEVLDTDRFDFTIAAGFQLDSIILIDWQTSSTERFFAMGLDPGLDNVGNPSNVGTDLLPFWSAGPVPPGTYSFGLENLALDSSGFALDSGVVDRYELDFVVGAVPEPSTALLIATGLVALAVRRRPH